MEPDDFASELAGLSPADRALVREYLAFLRWRASRTESAGAPALQWRYNFLEHSEEADVRATKNGAGMEVKTALANVGGEQRPALWQHPPVQGESIVEFHVPVPADLTNVRLRFAAGVREANQVEGQLVAFRVRVDGWLVWSRASWPAKWEAAEVALPFQAGNVMRIAFATDALGKHRFAWSVWGEPELIAEVKS